MAKQNQHRVPQVYLKEFGYRTKGGQWKISALEKKQFPQMKESNKIFYSQQNIKSVTAEYNIFDLDGGDPNGISGFEDLNGKLENWYPKIIGDLRRNNKLSDNSEGILIQLISNLLCRGEQFRELIDGFLNSESRLRFLQAMCCFLNDKGDGFINYLNSIPIELQLNPACVVVIDHILNKLSSFDYIILKDFNNRGWITSDNPVVLDNNRELGGSVFSVNTELYLPLSKDLCVFFSHSNAKNKSNQLRAFENKSVVNASQEIREMIYDKVRLNSDKFIFSPSIIKETAILNPERQS